MKLGDRVELIETLEDLQQGSVGQVVKAKEHVTDNGNLSPYIATWKQIDVLAVLFTGQEHPAITRRDGERVIRVIDKCKKI